MNTEKKKFIESYIAKIEQAITTFEQTDPLFTSEVENDIFNLLLEIGNVFEHDLPNINYMVNQGHGPIIADAKSVLGMLKDFLIENQDESNPLPQNRETTRNKIFISHRSTDKKFASLIEQFLTACGVPSANIFCSSLPGNDIKREISNEVKENLELSIFNIVLLSKEYYESPYCLNEAGVIWYMNGTIPMVVIALPEITDKNMVGFVNNEYKIRRLDNSSDIFAICDMVKNFFNGFITSTAKLNDNVEILKGQYTESLRTRFTETKVLEPDAQGYFHTKILADRGLKGKHKCFKIEGLLPTGEPILPGETHWLFFSADKYTFIKPNLNVKFKGKIQPIRHFDDVRNTRNIYITDIQAE